MPKLPVKTALGSIDEVASAVSARIGLGHKVMETGDGAGALVGMQIEGQEMRKRVFSDCEGASRD